MRSPSLDLGLPGDTVSAAGAARKRVPVLLPYPFAGPFDYAVPDGMDVRPGDMVLVPLNRRAEVGVVWDAPHGDPVPAARLKPIDAVLDAPPMQPALRQFIDWVAAYTLAPPGDVLAMALRINALAPPTPQAGWSLAELPADARMTDARRRVADLLGDGVPRTGAALARDAGVSPAVVRGMAGAGLLLPTLLPSAPPFAAPDPLHPGPDLSPAQAAAAAALRGAVAAAAFSVTCWTASPGPARPRCTWRRWPNASPPGGRRWCCCRRSRCPRSGWSGSPRGSARRPRCGTRTCRRAPGGPPGARWRRAARPWWWARAPPCSCRSRTWA